MKHTLKSLLITSMLTLPSVFASHSILETESDTPPAANLPHATPEDILTAAQDFRNLGNLYPEGSKERSHHFDRSAAFYQQASTHPNATLQTIQNAAY